MDASALKALLGPLSQQVFDALIVPLLQQEIAKIGDPAILAAVNSVLPAVKTLIDAELAKI